MKIILLLGFISLCEAHIRSVSMQDQDLQDTPSKYLSNLENNDLLKLKRDESDDIHHRTFAQALIPGQESDRRVSLNEISIEDYILMY